MTATGGKRWCILSNAMDVLRVRGVDRHQNRKISIAGTSGRADGMWRTVFPVREADPGPPTEAAAAVGLREIGSGHHQRQTTGGATRNSLNNNMKSTTGVLAVQGTTTGMEGHTETETEEVEGSVAAATQAARVTTTTASGGSSGSRLLRKVYQSCGQCHQETSKKTLMR